MKVTFYGTRGSIPVSGRDFIQVGGNTSCVLVEFDNGRIAILDAGTGIRNLGIDIINKSINQFDNIFIGLSHTHLDHIHGFPFFKPAYNPKRNFTIAICGTGREDKNLETVFDTQMRRDFFPVPLYNMGGNFNFWEPDVEKYEAHSGIVISASKHTHPGNAYGYRIQEGEKTLVYCTDVEHVDGIDPAVVALSKNADLLIHDAQYTTDELKEKKGWGHSSFEQAIEVAKLSRSKKLALFHHDPEHNDDLLLNIQSESKKIFPEAFLAIDGMTVKI